MYYSHSPHINSEDDLTIMWCRCGWRSEELSQTKVVELGVPWYCDWCGNKNLMWVKFHPNEREKARMLVPEILTVRQA